MAYIHWNAWEDVQEIAFYKSIGNNAEAKYLMNLWPAGTFTGVFDDAPAGPAKSVLITPETAEPEEYNNSAREAVLNQFNQALLAENNPDKARAVLESAAAVYGDQVYDQIKFYIENYERLTKPKDRGFGVELLKNISPENALLIAGTAIFPNAGTAIGETLGLSGQAGTVAGGALLGAGVSTATGGDPLQGAISGVIGSIGSTTYATDVGNALGVTGEAAKIVGNAVINSALSGIAAAATGGNIEKSMLAGAVGGAAVAGAEKVAEAILGKKVIASLAKTTGLKTSDVANIFTTSIANGIVSEINNSGDFLESFKNSLISSGVGTKAANTMESATEDALKENPAIRASVISATKSIASVATNAALNGIDIEDALEKSAPGIILVSIQAGQREADRQEELAAKVKKDLGATQQSVLLAGPPSAETLAQIQSQPTVSEQAIFSDFVDTEDGGFQHTRVQGTRNDGSVYEYDIFTYEDGRVVYAVYNSNLQSEYFDTRPNLTNRNDLGLTTEEVARRDYTAGIDLRDTTGTGGAGRAVLGGGGIGGGGNAVGFNFIGVDSDGREKYDIGGESFTLFVFDNQKILRNDVTAVELIPIVRPRRPTDPNPTPVVDLKENPEPSPPPPSPPPPKPVDLKPGEKAKDEEGLTGAKGKEGAAGGAPSTPTSPAPAPPPQPTPIPTSFPNLRNRLRKTLSRAFTPAPAPTPALSQQQIDDLAKQAEEERQRQEMAKQAEEKARLEQGRLAAKQKKAKEEAAAAKNAAAKKAAEEKARQAAEQAARKAEEERRAREEAERARVAAEKLDNDVRAAQQRFDQIVAGTAPADFTVPEPQPDFDEEGYRSGQDALSRFTEAQKTYQDLAKQVQAQIDSLNSIKDEATKTFNALDPAVQDRLRSEFDNDIANLDSQINTLTTQRDEATNLATATANEIAETQAFLDRIRQERESMIGQARELRTVEEQARYERERQQFEDEARRLEEALQRAEQEGTAAAQRQVSAFQKGQRLAKEGLVVGDTRSALQREIDQLIQSEQDAAQRARTAASQRETLVAPQQPGDAGRAITDADIMRLLGLGPGEGERYGFAGDGDQFGSQGETSGPSAGKGPGGGVEGEGGGSAEDGFGTGAGEFGVGPGAGEEGEGIGGGGEGEVGAGEIETPLSPRVVFDPTAIGRPETLPFASRVTGEALEGILGEKEPLFGGDEDEQRAVWNRRSLRLLSRALGL